MRLSGSGVSWVENIAKALRWSGIDVFQELPRGQRGWREEEESVREAAGKSDLAKLYRAQEALWT